MALVIGNDFIKNEKHMKGYVMMEIVPRDTADKIFAKEEYQKWEYIKPYILDLLKVPNFYIVYLRSYAKKYSNVAGATGLEPATSGVTGRHSNQLNYAPN